MGIAFSEIGRRANSAMPNFGASSFEPRDSSEPAAPWLTVVSYSASFFFGFSNEASMETPKTRRTIASAHSVGMFT
jgi:hypothetical protein